MTSELQEAINLAEQIVKEGQTMWPTGYQIARALLSLHSERDTREKEWRIHWMWDDGNETNCQPEPEVTVNESLALIKKGIYGVSGSMIRNPRRQWRYKSASDGPWNDADKETPNA